MVTGFDDDDDDDSFITITNWLIDCNCMSTRLDLFYE